MSEREFMLDRRIRDACLAQWLVIGERCAKMSERLRADNPQVIYVGGKILRESGIIYLIITLKSNLKIILEEFSVKFNAHRAICIHERSAEEDLSRQAPFRQRPPRLPLLF